MEDDATNGIDNDSTTRRGRFRVSAPPAGPPETTVGRFRLVPQTGTYGPTSPFLQRGRFSVIPEEPQNSPGGTNITPAIVVTDRQESPDWDFDDEKTVQECPMVVQNGIVSFISDLQFPVVQCASHDLRLDDVDLCKQDVPEKQLTELDL